MMRQIKTIIRILIVILFTTSTAHALDLSDAKQQGLIGEQLNGYLGIVTPSPSSEVRSPH